MSSSAEPLGWEAFRERTAPDRMELLSPASELLAVLQRGREDLDAERETNRQAAAAVLSAAAEQAALIHQFDVVLKRHEAALAEAGLAKVHRQLRIVRQQMANALDALDLVVVDPLGKPFDETEHLVEVTGWRHGSEFQAEVVAETLAPIVLHHDTPVRHGRVIMGAPSTMDSPAAAAQDTEEGKT
jgi:hypothetical protein